MGHSKQLLNKPSWISQETNDEINSMETKINLDLPSSEDEVLSTIVHLQCDKTGVLNNITPELINVDGPEVLAKLTAIYAHC